MITRTDKQDIIEGLDGSGKRDLTFPDSAEYYVEIEKNKNISAVGGLIFYKNKVVIKSLYVPPPKRGRGHFKKMLTYLIRTAINRDRTIAEATCTAMAIREFKNRGFREIKRYNNYTKVRNENIRKTKCI